MVASLVGLRFKADFRNAEDAKVTQKTQKEYQKGDRGLLIWF